MAREDTTADVGEAAFAAELLAASEPAFRVIRSVGLSPDDAADALQEAAMRAWRHRAKRRGDFRAWFVTIAYREARRQRRVWLTIPAVWNARTDEQELDSPSEELLASLRTLPKRQRLALSLRYDADLSTASVAQIMHISEPAAKQLLARARESLRQALSASTQRSV